MLKQLREKNGLAQEEVARRIGVALGTYRRWETGGAPKQWEQLIALAEVLNCQPEALVKRKK